MTESIFDLQTEISNLIVRHGLENGEFAFIYREGKLMVVDLSQTAIKNEVVNRMSESSQETE